MLLSGDYYKINSILFCINNVPDITLEFSVI